MKDQRPLFSVIIPTYNRSRLLFEAIQSVLRQSVNNWEVIVVDDGSTDNSKDIVRSIEDSRVHYFFQENKERSAARNLGIQNAKGQYLCFLDDDDYFLPNHLEVLEKCIAEHNFPVAIFRTGMLVKQRSRLLKSPLYDPKKLKHPIPFFLKYMVGIHTLCYHRKVLERYKYDERWFHFQDTHLLIRCLLDFPFYQIPEHTTVYVRYPEMGSLSIFRQENPESRTENNVNAIKDLFKQGGARLLKYVPTRMENQLVARKYLDHANGALHVGRKQLALKYIRMSLKVNKGGSLLLRYLKFGVRYFLALFR